MLLSHKCFPTKDEDEKEFSTTAASAPPSGAEPLTQQEDLGGSWRAPHGPFTPGSEEEMGSEPLPLPAFTGCFKCWGDLKILFYFAIKFNF